MWNNQKKCEMKKTYYKILKYSIIYFFYFLVFDSLSQDLKWERIENASGYRVQVRDENQNIVLDKKVKTNSYELRKNIKAGVYQHRIGVLDKLGVAKSWTNWISFEVVVSSPPKLTNDKPIYSFRDESPKKIVLEGENFTKETKVTIRSNGNQVPIQDTNYINSKKIEIELDTEKAPLGDYDLVLENPKGKSYQKRRFFVLKERGKTCEIFPPLWRSSLVPGWGQYYRADKCKTKESWKGKVYPAITLVLLAAYYQTNQNYNQKLSDYNNSINTTFLIPMGEPLQVVNFLDSEQRYQSARQAVTQLNQVSTLLLGFYLWNIVDIFLFHPYKQILPQPKEESSNIFFYSRIYQNLPQYNRIYNKNNIEYTLGFKLRF